MFKTLHYSFTIETHFFFLIIFYLRGCLFGQRWATSLQASSISAYLYLNPYSRTLLGTTYCPLVIIIALSWWSNKFKMVSGTGRKAGLLKALANDWKIINMFILNFRETALSSNHQITWLHTAVILHWSDLADRISSVFNLRLGGQQGLAPQNAWSCARARRR